MSEKLISLFMAIYLFFAGLPYGNQPVKVEFAYEMETTQETYTVGDWIGVRSTLKNKGRPFLGWNYRSVNCSFFQTINGEKKYLKIHLQYTINAEVKKNQPVLLKEGNEVGGYCYGTIMEGYEPGVYSMVLSYLAYDGTVYQQEFENVITVY